MKQFFALCLCFLLILIALPAAAQNLNADNMGTIPVLHQGRVKPLDTLARLTLKQIYGRENFETQSASAWIAEALFDPIASSTQKIFRIENPNLRHRLGVTERKKPLYSFSEISNGLNTTLPQLDAILKQDRKHQSKDDLDLIHLHEAAIAYTQILRSLSLILPLNIEVPDDWANAVKMDKQGLPSFLSLKKIEASVMNKTKEIIARKGDDLNTYTPDEQKIILFSYQLQLLQNAADRNELLRIIPSPWDNQTDGQKGEWFSPWALYQSGKASPATTPLINDIKTIAAAYNAGNQIDFDTAINSYKNNVFTLAPSVNKTSLTIEQMINKYNPLTISKGLYILSLITALILLSMPQIHTGLYRASHLFLLTGATIHGLGILSRIVILERPPVGTLYESIIFVGFVTAVIALLSERKAKDGSFIMLGAIAATALGFLSSSITDNQDSMMVLSAVLNTQFWLATHVLCITLGYAWCLMVSALSHLLLFGMATKKITPARIESFSKTLHTLTLIALLLTAIGTILGGIWADQSWGRFWGWDPKENGALLIVLWLAFILHAQVGNTFKRPILLGLLAFTSVIVALAWIGVNLLGVGLHSYGFTEGLFWGLGLFCLLEFGAITTLIQMIKRR